MFYFNPSLKAGVVNNQPNRDFSPFMLRSFSKLHIIIENSNYQDNRI